MFTCLVRMFFNCLTCFNPSSISKYAINHQNSLLLFLNINRSVFSLNSNLKKILSQKQICIFTKYRFENFFRVKNRSLFSLNTNLKFFLLKNKYVFSLNIDLKFFLVKNGSVFSLNTDLKIFLK